MKRIKIHVRSSFNNSVGTIVLKEEKKLEKEVVTGLTSSENDAKITLKGYPTNQGWLQYFGLLSKSKMALIDCSKYNNDGTSTYFHCTIR